MKWKNTRSSGKILGVAPLLKAHWLRPAFAESYWLLRVTLSKELVAVRVWNAPDQSHNWRVAGA